MTQKQLYNFPLSYPYMGEEDITRGGWFSFLTKLSTMLTPERSQKLHQYDGEAVVVSVDDEAPPPLWLPR